jgi:hypothetical protein
MDFDENKVDDAALALLYLTLHDNYYSWKGFDWGVLNRLHEKGLIDNPRNKNKSISFTPEGLEKAEELFKQLFQSSPTDENQQED